MDNTTVTLDYLLQLNQDYVLKFASNPLMALIKSSNMQNSTHRMRLLDCVQVFSNYFQKTIMLRAIFNNESRFEKIAHEHLQEEFGHDISLMHDRHERPPIWDPILEACSCWFSWKMLTLDDSQKTLLVHMVLESSAHLFFKEAHSVMTLYSETNYFKIHSEADEHHENMGIEVLQGLSEQDYAKLQTIQKQGWDVLNAVCARIANLTLERDEPTN